jgi:hypothetical protein
MSSHTIATILPTLMVGWLMVVAGFGKRKLERRPHVCPRCGQRACMCSSRR